jgi:hypothetical protein
LGLADHTPSLKCLQSATQPILQLEEERARTKGAEETLVSIWASP